MRHVNAMKMKWLNWNYYKGLNPLCKRSLLIAIGGTGGNRTPLCENSYKKTLDNTKQPAACQASPRPNSPSLAGSTTDSTESGLAHCISFISTTAFTLILNVRTSITIDLTTALAAFLTLMSIDRQFEQVSHSTQIRQEQIPTHMLKLVVRMFELVMRLKTF